MGARTYHYGNYLYRRTTPIDLIVPGLAGLTVDLGAEADVSAEPEADDVGAAAPSVPLPARTTSS